MKILKSILFLWLLILVPAQLVAAPPAPAAIEERDAPVSEEAHELAFLNGEVEYEEPKQSAIAPSRFQSGLKQFGGGLIGGLAVGFVGVMIGGGVCPPKDGDWGNIGCALAVGAVGHTIGTTAGVWIVGETIGWDGSIWTTLLGSALGTVLLAATVSDAVGLVFLLAAPAGGAFGYQISAEWPGASSSLAAPKSTMFTIVDVEF